jgi:hypothetical protein
VHSHALYCLAKHKINKKPAGDQPSLTPGLCGCGWSPPARQPRERLAPIYNQHYRRRHGRQYRDDSDIGRLSVIGRWLDWFLKELEKCSAGISDLPSRIVP